MKIAIVTSHFTPTLGTGGKITNGLDAIVLNAVPILLAAGHELHFLVAGECNNPLAKDLTVHTIEQKCLNELSTKSDRMALTRSYYTKCVNKLKEINPDWVWSHVPNPGTSSKFAELFPTTHHVHETNQNAMYSTGRLKGLHKVISNGGSVYNSKFSETMTKSLAKAYMERTDTESDMYLIDEVTTTHFQFCNTPLEPYFLETDVSKIVNDPPTLMVGRYDDKFTGKNLHLVDRLGIPITAISSGHNERVFKQLTESKTAAAYINTTREITRQKMSGAGTFIIGCVHESCPVFNAEMLCLGMLPISLCIDDETQNAGQEIASRIFGDDVQKSIPVRSEDLKVRIEEAIEKELNRGQDHREEVSAKSRKVFSHEAWYKELIGTIPVKTKSVHIPQKKGLDLF